MQISLNTQKYDQNYYQNKKVINSTIIKSYIRD